MSNLAAAMDLAGLRVDMIRILRIVQVVVLPLSVTTLQGIQEQMQCVLWSFNMAYIASLCFWGDPGKLLANLHSWIWMFSCRGVHVTGPVCFN